MKKLLLALPLLVFLFIGSGCDGSSRTPMTIDDAPIVPHARTRVDLMRSGGEARYTSFVAPRTETQSINVYWTDEDATASLNTRVYHNGSVVAEGTGGLLSFETTADETYTVRVQASTGGEFRLHIMDSQWSERNLFPFETRLMGTDLPAMPNVGPNDPNPLRAWEVVYEKNPHGRYIFANNPEQISDVDLNIPNIQMAHENARYKFTLSHSNRMISHDYIWLGYRLVNHGDIDLVVCVLNTGLQMEGEWLGARSWADFYNLFLELPHDYFIEGSTTEIWWPFEGQDFLYYHPRVFMPETFVVPPGEYIWLFGGTTADNFNNANVGGTADIPFMRWRCANGQFLFDITQGEDIIGEFIFYTDARELNNNMDRQGYIILRPETSDISYFEQYKGWDDRLGPIEASFEWIVNDNTPSGNLPVYYYQYRDNRARGDLEPYTPHDVRRQRVPRSGHRYNWQNAISQHIAPDAIGTDMSRFHYYDTDGNRVLVDALHTDGGGNIANLGNWMVAYQDNFTFFNAGSEDRTFRIFKQGAVQGALAVFVRDRDGYEISTYLVCHPLISSNRDHIPFFVASNYYWDSGTELYWPIMPGSNRPYFHYRDERSMVHEVVVPAGTVVQLTIEYVILANSNGGIRHWVELV